MTERFTRTGADTVQYQATVNDPKTWTGPWTVSFPLKRDDGYGFYGTRATRATTRCGTSSAAPAPPSVPPGGNTSLDFCSRHRLDDRRSVRQQRVRGRFRQLLAERHAEQFPRGHEERRQYRAQDEAREAEQAQAAERGDENQQRVHLRVPSHQPRAQHVVHSADRQTAECRQPRRRGHVAQ